MISPFSLYNLRTKHNISYTTTLENNLLLYVPAIVFFVVLLFIHLATRVPRRIDNIANRGGIWAEKRKITKPV